VHQMNKQTKTNAELIEEISSLKQRIQELEQAESEHKRTEEALRESEEKYRWMLDNMSDVITIMDMNLRLSCPWRCFYVSHRDVPLRRAR